MCNSDGKTNPALAESLPGRIIQSTDQSNAVDTMSPPVQRTSSMYVSQCSSECKDLSLSDKPDSKRAEQQHKKRADAASIFTRSNNRGVPAFKSR